MNRSNHPSCDATVQIPISDGLVFGWGFPVFGTKVCPHPLTFHVLKIDALLMFGGDADLSGTGVYREPRRRTRPIWLNRSPSLSNSRPELSHSLPSRTKIDLP
jgi:hypothetical protein